MKIINHTRYSKFTLRSLARAVWARAITQNRWWDYGTIEFKHGIPRRSQAGFPSQPYDYSIHGMSTDYAGPYLVILLPKQTVASADVAEVLWKAMMRTVNGTVERTDFGFVTLKFGPALVERQPKVPTKEEKLRKDLARIGRSIAKAEKTIKWQTTHLKTIRKKEASLQKRLDACRKVD